MAAILESTVAEWNSRLHGDRRRAVPRRRDLADSLHDPYRPDDRRFGLGRRWEDWCRPSRVAAVDRPRRVARG